MISNKFLDEFSRVKARDLLSGALNQAASASNNHIEGSGHLNHQYGNAVDLLEDFPDLTDGLDTPLKKIIKYGL